MAKVVVVGSINMDLVFRTAKRPDLGETVKGIDFNQFPGGKGANQGVAAARLGAEVYMVGKVGKDPYGQELLNCLKREGVNTEKVKYGQKSTGLANIVVDEQGQNTIITIEGANGEVNPEDIDEELFSQGDIALFQLEIPIETVVHGVKLAKKRGATVILDPAPVRELPLEIYQYIDIIKPNEGEALALTKEGDIQSAAAWLINKGVKKVVITLGEKGAVLFAENLQKEFPAPKVSVVDTTAAGDSFSGALALALSKGEELEKAIQFATKVGSITVTKLGAQSSLPTLAQVQG
ncbi:ribokinase [Anaerobranca californiensis DSM 14826]|uniref:Ribokinase n=1 Tax=Anaerobranca californiensis DSM 14826 TaxID=1120989 RepID=A0A1M6Q924_9FIRM|nr:ribokinase [Anaerobranca californiensis]SHK16597.1 ribokinase [Anaerobranca californiensis DSM 14826]